MMGSSGSQAGGRLIVKDIPQDAGVAFVELVENRQQALVVRVEQVWGEPDGSPAFARLDAAGGDGVRIKGRFVGWLACDDGLLGDGAVAGHGPVQGLAVRCSDVQITKKTHSVLPGLGPVCGGLIGLGGARGKAECSVRVRWAQAGRRRGQSLARRHNRYKWTIRHRLRDGRGLLTPRAQALRSIEPGCHCGWVGRQSCSGA